MYHKLLVDVTNPYQKPPVGRKSFTIPPPSRVISARYPTPSPQANPFVFLQKAIFRANSSPSRPSGGDISTTSSAADHVPRLAQPSLCSVISNTAFAFFSASFRLALSWRCSQRIRARLSWLRTVKGWVLPTSFLSLGQGIPFRCFEFGKGDLSTQAAKGGEICTDSQDFQVIQGQKFLATIK